MSTCVWPCIYVYMYRVSKRQASRAADCQLSPRLPDCFLLNNNAPVGGGPGPGQNSSLANQSKVTSVSTSGQLIEQQHQRATAGMSHSPVARRSHNHYSIQNSSQLSHVSANAMSYQPQSVPKMSQYPQHSLVSTGNSIMAGHGGEMQQLSLMQP